jgi:hypothetical protein
MDEDTGMEPTQLGGSSKFAVGYQVPGDFADVLRDLTREILRYKELLLVAGSSGCPTSDIPT